MTTKTEIRGTTPDLVKRIAPHVAIPAGIALMVVVGADSPYYTHLATSAAIAYVLTASFNLVFGYAGIFSMASIALYGIGAYASVYLVNQHGWNFWLAMVAATAMSALVGALIILPTGHLKDMFIAIVTLGFAVSVSEIFTQWKSVTGGAVGISTIEPPTFFGTLLVGGSLEFLVLCAVVVWFIAEVNWRISRSGLGRKLVAVRESPRVLPAVGVDSTKVRLYIFVLSSAMAGLAGVLHAHFQLTISPAGFSVTQLIVLLLAAVVGGAGTFMGPVVGVVVLLIIGEVGTSLGRMEPFIYGIVIVILMSVGRHGLVPVMGTGLRAAGRRVAKLASRGREPNAQPLMIQRSASSRPELPSRAAATSADAKLIVNDVNVAFGGVKAVAGVTISVGTGQIVGLIGPNGAGKTTLFNAITGECPSRIAKLELDGRSLIGTRPHERRRAGLARTYQLPTLVPNLSVIENVMLGGELRSRAGLIGQTFATPASRADDRAHRTDAFEALARLGIAEHAELPVESQTYGVQRLTEIARCLLLRPDILLLDEPGAGLTPEDREQVAAVTLDLRDSGLSVLIIDHNVDFMRSISDELVVMNNGEELARGNPAEVLRKSAVVQAYLGSEAARV